MIILCIVIQFKNRKNTKFDRETFCITTIFIDLMSHKEEIANYLDKMKEVQKAVLDYIENGSNSEEDLENLNKFFDEKNLRNNKHELKATLRLRAQISNDHHRSPIFLTKIQKIVG